MVQPFARISGALALLSSVACNGISYPTAPAATPTPVEPRLIQLTANPPALPTGGGASTIYVEVVGTNGAGVPTATVSLTASAGTLETDRVVTDSTGHAKVGWSGTQTSTVTARVGEVAATMTMMVEAPPVVPPRPEPPAPPAPGPTPPAPTPTPTPPAPTPPVPQPTPSPAGDLVLTINTTPAAPVAGSPVTFSGALSSTTSAPLPRMDLFVWDLNDDRLPDGNIGATPSFTYAEGTHRIYLTVYTSDHREVQATRTITVGPAPALTASLVAPASVVLGDPVPLSVTTTQAGIVGALSYDWDFDGNGTTDQTTVVPTTNAPPYTTIGAKTIQVTVRGAIAASATSSAPLTVTAPALNLVLAASPATPGVGVIVTFTATVTVPSGPAPTGLVYAWDLENDGTFESTTNGNVYTDSYATPGARLARVRVTSTDGRTATTTVAVTVT